MSGGRAFLNAGGLARLVRGDLVAAAPQMSNVTPAPHSQQGLQQ